MPLDAQSNFEKLFQNADHESGPGDSAMIRVIAIAFYARGHIQGQRDANKAAMQGIKAIIAQHVPTLNMEQE